MLVPVFYLHKALPWPPLLSSCFLREEWSDSLGLKHPCEEGRYHLVGGPGRLPEFQARAACSYHESNSRTAAAQVLSQRVDGFL